MARKECDIKLWDPDITSNKAMLHCQGGVVLHLLGECTEVQVYLSDEGLDGLIKHLEWIKRFDGKKEDE